MTDLLSRCRVLQAGARVLKDEVERMRGPHDVGGLDFGPIDPEEYSLTFWELQMQIPYTGECRRS